MNPSANVVSADVYAWIILPALIFVARVADVTLGTLRIVFVTRGRRLLAPAIGFFEVLIWIVVIGQVVQNLHSAISYIAYSAGFATGTYVGLYLEDKLAMGMVVIRVITNTRAGELIDRLHEAQFGVTSVDAEGATGRVKLVYTIIKRKDLASVMAIVNEINPKAFLSVEELRSAQAGIFPPTQAADKGVRWRLLASRKGK